MEKIPLQTLDNIESEAGFIRFLTDYENVILWTIVETLMDFLPDYDSGSCTGEVGEYASMMASVSSYLLVNIDTIKNIQEFGSRDALNVYVITATTHITLKLLEEQRAIKLCPHWEPSELVKPIINKTQGVFFYFHRHIVSCEVCRKCHFICLRVNNQTVRKDPSLLTKSNIVTKNDFWTNSKKDLAEQLNKEEKKYIKGFSFPVLAVAASFLLILSLTSCFYFFLDRQIPKSLITTKAPNNKPYDRLDDCIDLYLEFKNIAYLEQAEETAKQIEANCQDKYGVDLVAYYKSVADTNLDHLFKARKELKELLAIPTGDKYEIILTRAAALESRFISYGNELEAQRARALMVKQWILTSDPAYKPILAKGLSESEANNHRFLKLYFLLWKGKSPTEVDAEKALEEVTELSKLLNVQEVQISASMSLAATYEINGKNREAFRLAKETLELKPVRYTHTIALYQIAAMACFKLEMYQLSDQYVQQAISLSEQNQNNYMIASSYALSGTLFSLQQQFERAESLFNKAEKLALSLEGHSSRVDILSRLQGYRAKNKLMQGDYQAATKLYKTALGLIEGLHEKKLEISQLNEGLATALEKRGDKNFAYYRNVATRYSKEAKAKGQNLSCLISFLPMACK